MKDGFLRTACATPKIKVAGCSDNANEIIRMAKEAANHDASLIVFPELCITGYTCSDLFLQKSLILSAEKALGTIAEQTKDLKAVIIVGLPVASGLALYNCAAVLCGGKILGLVPKKHIPNYAEFYELRHFTSGNAVFESVKICGQYTDITADVIFQCSSVPELKLGVEICEDLWTAEPPSGKLALSGASVIANLSASDEVIGKADYRRMLVQSASARLLTSLRTGWYLQTSV